MGDPGGAEQAALLREAFKEAEGGFRKLDRLPLEKQKPQLKALTARLAESKRLIKEFEREARIDGLPKVRSPPDPPPHIPTGRPLTLCLPPPRPPDPPLGQGSPSPSPRRGPLPAEHGRPGLTGRRPYPPPPPPPPHPPTPMSGRRRSWPSRRTRSWGSCSA